MGWEIMNEYSKKWWFWGLTGAVLLPVIMLAIDGFTHPLQGEAWRPYIAAFFLAFAGGLGMVAVPVLPVWPWLRMVLFFVYIPLFICAVRAFAPWLALA